MLIVCPSCATVYEIASEKLGAGRKVRCARCQKPWLASPEAEPATAEAGLGEWSAATGSDVKAERAAEGAPADTPPANAADAPPLVPAEAEIETAPPGTSLKPEPPEDVESVAARRIRIVHSSARRRGWRPSLPVVIVGLAAILAGLVAARVQIVRAAPQTASLYSAVGLPVNLRGVVFENVTTAEEIHENVPLLVVAGEVVNIARVAVEVPRFRFAVRNAAGVELYAWTALPGREVISPGETLPFRSRLASPPPGWHDVMVRFFHRRDLEAAR